MNNRLSLVILMGLPASGKTLLANHLKEQFELPTWILSYDDLISDEPLIEIGEWKKRRSSVFEAVKFIASSKFSENSKPTSELLNKIISLNSHTENPLVIIIDDNMFYRSMRYKYFQLARDLSLGFCVLNISCPLHDALERNQNRCNKVLPDVIINMTSKLELPDPQAYPWEGNNITLELNYDLNVVIVKIKKMLHEPIQKLVVYPDREADIKVCECSLLHQLDLGLRRHIAKIVRQHRSNGHSVDKNFVTQLSDKRNYILKRIKTGDLKIPVCNSQKIVEKADDCDIIIQELFTCNKAEKI